MIGELERAECRDRLARRVSVMIFAEGTRSPTDDLLPFKDGAFHLAIESRVPILPIAFDYSTRSIVIGALFHPTSDLDADIAALRATYVPFHGRNHDVDG